MMYSKVLASVETLSRGNFVGINKFVPQIVRRIHDDGTVAFLVS